jgi:tyrosyl-tRNA synthetase
MSSHNEARSNRLAQKHLAYEVTKIVHGAERADAVRRVSEVLFGEEDYTMLTEADFAELRDEIPTLKVAYGTEIVDVLVGASLASSKGEARRFLQSNAVYINGEQLPLIKTQLDTTDAIHGYCILRRGKNMTALLEFTR